MGQHVERSNGGGRYTAESLERGSRRVRAAAAAEKRVYEHYGLERTEHTVDVPELDRRVRAVETGTETGPPLVAIQGGIGHGVLWAPLLPELIDYRLLVVDRPGGGLSDGIDYRAFPLETVAVSSTRALFDHFDLDAAPILGNSMGGLWALRFALAHPDRVSAIVLLGCPALFPDTSAPFPMRLMSLPVLGGVLVARLMQPDDATDAREAWRFLGHPDETATRLPREFDEAVFRMETLPTAHRSWTSLLRRALRLRGARPEAAFTSADLRRIRPPVLLLWGRDDPFGTVEQGRRGAAYLPDAAFHEVGVGHLPWLDDPASCGESVREFLTEHA
ncbi:alpha/beta fold hydrolase [Salinigranum salinum]|uniref:alpha/beta fold hydrolase n=1 Tax=Salinigranum salinum TaxID=1364937 RepID=UPI0018642A17|nr:alpha/beta hydrolase [Salinigranum salinum]